MSPCPSAEQLEQFLEGQQGDEQSRNLARHIDGCAACQSELDSLTGTLVLSTANAAHATEPLPSQSASHAHFFEKLKQNRPTADRRSGRMTGSRRQPEVATLPSVAGYEILAELGRGGMGVVYKARHNGLGRLVALKMILAGPHAGTREQLRFRQEAEAVARLRHANLIQIYDIGESNGHSYLALEFVEGSSLARTLRGTPQPLLTAARLVETLAEAMHYAHQQGVVHRDLKPANVLVQDADGIPKITDFGLAMRLDHDAAAQSGDLVGTPSYMAPEQAQDNGSAVTAATDVYALGAILYELLTGRPPFRGPTSLDTVLQVLHQDPVRPGSFRSDLPRDLETICLKCLAKDPARRYANAEALAADLARFRKGQPIKARPVGLHERVWKWARRRPRSAATVAATLLAVVLAYTTITFLWHAARTSRDESVRERELAEEARRNEAEQRRQARISLYFSRVAQSQLQWRLNDFHGAEQSLARCLPADGADDDRGWEWHYLQGLIHNDLFTLPHANSGLGGSVAYHHDGTRIATVVSGLPAGETLQPGEVRIWDARTGGLITSWTGPSTLDRVAFHPDGSKLALATADGLVLIWDARTGDELLRRPMHQGKVWSLAFAADGALVASAGADGRVKIWDSKTGIVRRDIRAHADEACTVAFHPERAVVATGSADTMVKLWDIDTGEEIRTLKGHKHAVLCVAFSPDGKSLASASGNGNIKLWDVDAGHITQSLTSDTRGILNVVFSADGRYLAKAGKDGSVRIWHLTTGVERMAFRGHASPVECVAFSPDCQRVASLSPGDGVAKVWDLTRHPEYATFARTGKDIEALVFLDQGRRLMSVTVDGKLQTWDAATGIPADERQFPVNKTVVSPAVPLVLSADGTLLAARSEDDPRIVKCWYTANAAEAFAAPPHAHPVFCIRFSPDGRLLATAACAVDGPDQPHEIKLFDIQSRTALGTWTGQGRIFNLAFAPNSQLLAWTGQAGRVTVWPWRAAQPLVMAGHRGDVTAVAFSLDGTLLASAGMEDRCVKIWSISEEGACRELHTLAAPTLICDLAFSPDHRRVAAISRDLVKQWDVQTGHEALTLRGASQRYWDPPFNPRVVFSPDGTLLAGTNWDETISLWDAPLLDADEQFAKLQERRRHFADERSNVWHLQEAELCLVYNNLRAARFHLNLVTDDFNAGPLQARKNRLVNALRDQYR